LNAEWKRNFHPLFHCWASNAKCKSKWQNIFNIHLNIVGVCTLYTNKCGAERCNNSIENLRAATSSQNQHNKRLQNNNTSGAKNVSYCLGRWEVKLKVNKKQIHIGRFDNFESATVDGYNVYERLVWKRSNLE
jgi:hypothetical protein